MEPATTAAPATAYTPEQIDRAMAFVQHSRQKEREKYQRNKAHRLAYSRAYYAANKEAISERQKAAYARRNQQPE
jgi:hypothetical protein